MVHPQLIDPKFVAARQAWERRLADPDDWPIYLRGTVGSGSSDMYRDPQRRMAQALAQLADRVQQLQDGSVFRPPCVNAGLHGVHFIDKLFGADVYELDGQPDNWQTRYLDTPVGSLQPPDLAGHPTWRAAQAFAQAFVDSGVTVPVFMLPTIASALNVGLNLYGQHLLLTMLTDPPAARRDLQTINDVLIEVHDWYRANIPFDQLHQVACGGRYQPPGCGQVCGCSTQLLSPEQYAGHIAELDDAVLARYPNGGMIHLCGTHTQHIPVWRDMTSLTAVQLNDRAAEDLETYLRDMPDKVYYVHPCPGMPQEHIASLAPDHKVVIVSE
jgi:hypothetical protein